MCGVTGKKIESYERQHNYFCCCHFVLCLYLRVSVVRQETRKERGVMFFFFNLTFILQRSIRTLPLIGYDPDVFTLTLTQLTPHNLTNEGKKH